MTYLSSTDIAQTIVRHVVYTSPILTYVADWTEQPRIWCNTLTRSMAPEVDEAEFTVFHGYEINPAAPLQLHAPLSLAGLYVKVEAFDSTGAVAVTWFGRFEVDNREIDGSSDARTGTQRLTAYGLARELENAIIRTSVVLDVNGDPQRIGRGLVANSHFGTLSRGNRSASQVAFEGSTTYVYSHEAISGTPWTAETYIEYLLAHQTPRDENGDTPVIWQLVMPGGSFDWLDVSVDTDRRSVKAVLDEILDRRRLSGYYVTGLELADAFQINVVVVSFNDAAIGTIPANPNTRTIVVDDGHDCRADVIVSETQVAERVIVEGAPITVTATWPTAIDSPDGLAPRWTAAQETDYLAGAAGDEVENARARTRDELAAVFREFVIDDDFGGLLPDLTTGTPYRVSPDLVKLDAGLSVALVFVGDILDPPPAFAWRSARFLPYLALVDDETGEYRRPFMVAPDYDADGVRLTSGGEDVWCLGHEANYDAEEDGGRAFACDLRILQDAPGVVVEVDGKPPQLLARSDWAGAATTAEGEDPEVDANRALDFREMLCTLCHETDDRIRVIRETTPAAAGQPMRERVIRINDARFDALLPGTVVDIDADGLLVHNSGTLRDDRTRMGKIADAAAEWYGKPRRSLRVSYGQFRVLADLGTLVTSIGTTHADVWTDANAVVTQNALDFDSATTTLNATYPEIDFGALL